MTRTLLITVLLTAAVGVALLTIEALAGAGL
jgi:hypothetical protein